MSSAPPIPLTLGHQFADELPELTIPWQAEAAPEPRLLALNGPLATELGLDEDWMRSPAGLQLLVGTLVPDSAKPVAQGYSGHQFGNYSPRLGDGRALLLGELTDDEGRIHDLHLKGSGRTPFSRGGDGLAAVGPMLREYVISEAMHALGVPTTRALAVVGTGAIVQREVYLPGAVLARVASSHLRVGSFQYARATDDLELLRRLADHAIARHHPELIDADNRYRALFDAVIAAQAELIAQWMLVGFVHGVMNTDNMTISGETIDYGPCAFLESYDPATVYSSIDEGGRYAYGNQPAIGQWNLTRLAESLLPLFDGDQEHAVADAVASLGAYAAQYTAAWTAGMHAKLGLAVDAETGTLLDDVLTLLAVGHSDWTSFFRRLSSAARGDAEPVRAQFLDLAGIDEWTARWLALAPDAEAMDRVNPLYIPRNHLVEQALAAGTEGDLAPLRDLLAVVTDPFTERAGLERFTEPAPQDFGDYQTFCGT